MDWKNREETNKYFRNYYQQNKEKINKRHKDYYEKNKEKFKIFMKKYNKGYYKKHRKELNIEATKRNKIKIKLFKNEIFRLLGNKCTNPFNIEHGTFLNDIRCLQIDHVNGGGCNERTKLGTRMRYYEHILRQIKLGSKDYQLLCANCNWIKWGEHIAK